MNATNAPSNVISHVVRDSAVGDQLGFDFEPDFKLAPAASPDDPLAGLDPAAGQAPAKVVLSYGLGVDSTAILLRWLHEPDSRDFDLDELVVVTAMTGDEWAKTGTDVEQHILPLLRRHGIRYVQAARARRHVTTTGGGLVVLDDSTSPHVLHLDGAYKLSDEMREAGTLPQSGGMRACSVHSKGDVLDPVIARLTGGQSFRHVIGFESEEQRRATKDALYNTSARTGEYPLLEWGWDRGACEAYIAEKTGIAWSKSACTMCPFAAGSKEGRKALFQRYVENPEQAISTLAMEHLALALNPKQGLIAGKRLADALVEAGHGHLIDLLQRRLDTQTYAVYEVRRILRPKADDPTKLANASRSVLAVFTGTRAEAAAALRARAASSGLATRTGEDGIDRVHISERGETLPALEHYLVAAPAGALDKQVAKFETWWAELAGDAAPELPAA